MREILATIELWRARHLRVALATVVGVERSAPRDPGAALAVNERGEVAGSVSGGCVEAAVVEEAQDALASGRARLASYGISDEAAFSVGLTCGGTIHVFIERIDDWPAGMFERLARALHAEEPIAAAARIDGTGAGRRLLVAEDESWGGLGTSGLTYAALGEARALLAAGEKALREFGPDGEPTGVEERVFIEAFAPKPVMYIFGAIDFSRAMATLAKYAGYRVVVVDARPVFATKARIPDADDVVVAWPDEYLVRAPVDERTAIVVLTHDPKFDIPLLRVALATRAGYIGAMGSRSTHASRVAELRVAGISEAQLARINAPIGLDIGARTPEETAVSILAEIVALRARRPGGRLSGGDEPIHPPRPPVLPIAPEDALELIADDSRDDGPGVELGALLRFRT
jgi:xanthine dehydrogenase accessory factor